jgi:UDP-N-acetylglucosamine 2-epimerase
MRSPSIKRILVVFGTRPEVIKLAPVIRELRRRSFEFDCRVISTGQHREMVQQALDAFGLKIDVQLDAMSSAQSLGKLTARLFLDLDNLLEREKPDWIIVQGDTTSAMVGAMNAFYRRIKIGHVEAGLRTYDRWSPFPEELNRTVIGNLADLHFAPTDRSAENLRLGGAPANAVHVTGNTVVDALLQVACGLNEQVPCGLSPDISEFIANRRLLLVTSHRRESFGEGLENICHALLGIVERRRDTVIVFPVHLNPNVREPVYRLLGNHARIKLMEPISYLPLVWLMKQSYFLLTDSGGIQEEAPSLGKPVLIMRETTERPEVVEAGCARLVGNQSNVIMSTAFELLDNSAAYNSMAKVINPFGDGRASQRIVDLLASALLFLICCLIIQ